MQSADLRNQLGVIEYAEELYKFYRENELLRFATLGASRGCRGVSSHDELDVVCVAVTNLSFVSVTTGFNKS